MIPPAAAAAFFHAAAAPGAPPVPDSTPTVGDLVAAYQASTKAVADDQAALAAATAKLQADQAKNAADTAGLVAEIRSGGPVASVAPDGTITGYEIDAAGNLAPKTFRPFTSPASPHA